MTDDRLTQATLDWLCGPSPDHGPRPDHLTWAKRERDGIRATVCGEATDEAAGDRLKAAVQALTAAYTGLRDLPLDDLPVGLMRAALPLVDWVAVARRFRVECH
jgi:hypothetical protein